MFSLKTTNFAKQMFKPCGRKLSVTSLANFVQKKSIKLFAMVKMYMHAGNKCTLIAGLQQGTPGLLVGGRK
jgi:hypothetical protein